MVLTIVVLTIVGDVHIRPSFCLVMIASLQLAGRRGARTFPNPKLGAVLLRRRALTQKNHPGYETLVDHVVLCHVTRLYTATTLTRRRSYFPSTNGKPFPLVLVGCFVLDCLVYFVLMVKPLFFWAHAQTAVVLL